MQMISMITNIIQRDLRVDGGLRPVSEEDVVAVRNKAARALQGLFDKLGLPTITDEEVESSKPMSRITRHART